MEELSMSFFILFACDRMIPIWKLWVLRCSVSWSSDAYVGDSSVDLDVSMARITLCLEVLWLGCLSGFGDDYGWDHSLGL